eukprot:403373781
MIKIKKSKANFSNKNKKDKESEKEEDDFMSDKFLLNAELIDQNIRKDKMQKQRFDTKIKNADKLKHVVPVDNSEKRLDILNESNEPEITRHNIKHQMFQKLQEGLQTKISKENKGFQLLMKLGFKEGQGLGKKESGIKNPLELEMKNNKIGIGIDLVKKEKVMLLQKYSEEMASSFVNAKKFEFLVKKLKRKLKDILTFLERQEQLGPEVDFCNLINYLIQDEVCQQKQLSYKQRTGSKRQHDREQYLSEDENQSTTLHDLLVVLSQMRVYLRENYSYCVKCKVGDIDKYPCKHCL